MATAPGGGFLERLTPRERTYILVLVLVFFVMGTLVLVYLRDGALRRTEKEIADIKLALDSMHTRGAVYKAKLEQKKQREAAISSDSVQFASMLDEARMQVEGVNISNEEEQPALPLGDSLIKRSYELDVRGITLEDLIKLLTFLENKPGHIIITENLLVRPTSSTEDRLNADVTLVTYERTAAEGAGGGAPVEDDREEP
jgi:hypothetical protein